jgi:crossover junction endodeoxyribonuclease RuvC
VPYYNKISEKSQHGKDDKQMFVCYNFLEILMMKRVKMRILGIDPGYAILGYGIIDVKGNKFSPVDYGAVLTEASMDMPRRLKTLYGSLAQLIRKYEPDEASIEELFFNNNAKTAILVGEARGVAVLACADGGLPIGEYTPLQIKQALVGYGRADKKQVQFMVKTMLGLESVPKPDDTADALAAAICHAHSKGRRDILKGKIR